MDRWPMPTHEQARPRPAGGGAGRDAMPKLGGQRCRRAAHAGRWADNAIPDMEYNHDGCCQRSQPQARSCTAHAGGARCTSGTSVLHRESSLGERAGRASWATATTTVPFVLTFLALLSELLCSSLVRARPTTDPPHHRSPASAFLLRHRAPRLFMEPPIHEARAHADADRSS